MFIKSISIKNFRLFNEEFVVDKINIPDLESEGNELTVFVGENGCGKTSILDAIALPLLNYKAENFQLDDLNDPRNDANIKLFSSNNFAFDGTIPSAKYKGKGFSFEAKIRTRENKSYLSSVIVNDQKFIKADGEIKPKDGSPDLRVNVNNPFKGQRFNENDVLYLDRNRTFQTRSGTFNPTRFDRIMEDFDYQYVKKETKIKNISEIIKSKITKNSENKLLDEAIEKFEEFSKIKLSLNILDNWKPFNKAFFGEQKENNFQINLNKFGSGYEMLFTLIYSFYLSKQSGKKLIILIDEPELHLHPSLQEKFVDFLIEISKESQIIMISHSPLLVKQLMYNTYVKVFILKIIEEKPQIVGVKEKVLPYISANEINYLAFNLPTIEYHNELYGYIQEKVEKYKQVDLDNWLHSECSIKKDKLWQKEKDGKIEGEAFNITIQTFIRNKIHHPENKTMQKSSFSNDELKKTLDKMRDILLTQ